MRTYKRGDPIAVMGMSGVGKTRIASILRSQDRWFHYSIDYRIGTRYMDEAIVDNFKREATKVPLLRELLLTDSIYISSNITFDNLDPLSTYLGKPGDPSKGGIPFDEYIRRQREHQDAEIRALMDTPLFVEKARSIYGYDRFICDTGGSICEVVDPEDENDPVLRTLSQTCLLVYIAGDDSHAGALKTRFDKNPKPMFYNETFLRDVWADYLSETGCAEENVDPDHFIRWGFARLIEWRRPRYQAMADGWGITIPANKIEKVRTPEDFLDLVDSARSES
ncbi:ATPase [Hyphococcus lacteus]|uniref:ATPase n=1 Tax=Hyphococcus lacteus TaxID=3143536 RepID=A0ABV3Z4U8_9PROT